MILFYKLNNMKKLLVIICLLGGISFTAQAQAQENEKIARQFLSNMQANAFQKAYDLFDPAFGANITVDKLGTIWESLQKQVGDYQGMGKAIAEKNGTKIKIHTFFAKDSLVFLASFNNVHKINGLFFLPPDDKSFNQGAKGGYNAPAYVKADLFTEEKIEVVTGHYHLPAILTLPKIRTKFPVVILVHGSGPNDMDETIGPNKPFKDLAQGLASMGIATLRYDKRTRVYAEEMMKKPDSLTLMTETVDDAVSAIDMLKKMKNIDPDNVFVLGHSQGGMMAPKIAAMRPSIKGIILMAGPSIPLADHILEQNEYFYEAAGRPAEAAAQMQEVRDQVALVKSGNVTLKTSPSKLPLNVSGAWWIDNINYDVVKTAQGIKNNMLILQGERDYQVTMKDVELWKKGLGNRKNVSYKTYPKLNHLFQEGEGKSMPSEYNVENHIPAYVLEDIAAWVKTGKVSDK